MCECAYVKEIGVGSKQPCGAASQRRMNTAFQLINKAIPSSDISICHMLSYCIRSRVCLLDLHMKWILTLYELMGEKVLRVAEHLKR